MTTALVIVGCGASTATRASRDPAAAPAAAAHPQAVQPVAGQVAGDTTQQAAARAPAGPPGPGQPASITGAPAKGAPSDAEVRAAIAKFQRAIAQYHLNRLNLAGALINPPPGQYYTSIASVYTDYGKPVACGGILQVPELGVANKTLPCGTEIIFLYNGRAIRVPVIDRGPYVAGREWDLTGAAAEALHFPGLGPIQWRYG